MVARWKPDEDVDELANVRSDRAPLVETGGPTALLSCRLLAKTARQEASQPIGKHPCVRGALALEHARFIE